MEKETAAAGFTAIPWPKGRRDDILTLWGREDLRAVKKALQTGIRAAIEAVEDINEKEGRPACEPISYYDADREEPYLRLDFAGNRKFLLVPPRDAYLGPDRGADAKTVHTGLEPRKD